MFDRIWEGLSLKECACGIPRIITRLTQWNDNGTITATRAAGFRVLLLESEMFKAVFNDIEREMGLDIGHIVFEAMRNAAFLSIKESLGAMPIKLMPRSLMLTSLSQAALALGQYHSNILDTKKGSYIEMAVKNPFDHRLVPAYMCGGAEALDGIPYEHDWHGESSRGVIRLQAADHRPEISERMALSFPHTLEGRRRFRRCQRCGFPSDLQGLRWKKGEGIILNEETGTRYVFIDNYAPAVVFRELANELGEAIAPIIVNAQYTHSLSSPQGLGLDPGKDLSGGEKAFDKVFERFALCGMGDAVDCRRDEGIAKITINNPYDAYLLAGQLKAAYRIIEGREADVSWSESVESRYLFELSPSR